MISSCTCRGYEAVFECTVFGDGATIWQGTALQQCAGQRIILRHSQFEPGYNINQTCGSGGPVVGRAVSAVNGSYTSQLTINVSQQLNGSTIECANDNESMVNTMVEVFLTTGAYVNLSLLKQSMI